MIIYENTIKSKGSLVGEFGDGMFILFGDNAPDMLKDYCYGIDVIPTNSTIEVGQVLKVDDHVFKILGVGNVAEKNLVDLGHLTVHFSGDLDSLLPGAIVVENKSCPKIDINTKITIEKLK